MPRGKGTGVSSELLSALSGKLLTLCFLGFGIPLCKMRGLISSFNKIFFSFNAYLVPGTVCVKICEFSCELNRDSLAVIKLMVQKTR